MVAFTGPLSSLLSSRHMRFRGCNAQSLSLRAALMNIARMANGKCEQVRITPLKFRSCKKAHYVPPVHMIKPTKNRRSRLTFSCSRTKR
jgi:hypothetical protein